GVGVVGAIDAGGVDVERGPGDIGRGARRGCGQRIVAGVRPTDGNAADADRLAAADVLVGEGRARVVGGQHVAGDAVVGQGDGRGGGGGGVVGVVDAGGADGERGRSDVGGGGGRGVLQGVVARVGAADCDAADAYWLRSAHVLIGEGGGRVAVDHHVAAEVVV